MDLIKELKKTVTMEVRENSIESEYLEAVVSKEHIPALLSVITNHLGKAFKSPGKHAKYPANIQTLVDSFGGLRIDQSLYYKEGDGKVMYAAIWPWQSDAKMTTIKIGIVTIKSTPKSKGFNLFAFLKK